MSREQRLKLPARLARRTEPNGDDVRLQISLRLTSTGDAEVEDLRELGANEPTQADLNRLACQIYDARRQREQMLNPKFFGEPGWDMLLALYCLPTRGERLGVMALSNASASSLTTALRWQAILLEDGLIERIPDREDARREFVGLSQTGRDLVEAYLKRMFLVGSVGG